MVIYIRGVVNVLRKQPKGRRGAGAVSGDSVLAFPCWRCDDHGVIIAGALREVENRHISGRIEPEVRRETQAAQLLVRIDGAFDLQNVYIGTRTKCVATYIYSENV